MFLCALRTGLRFGELAGLQWGDLDFGGRFIEVRRTLHEGGRTELPKNGKIRRVDMSRQLAEELRSLKALRAAEALKKEWGQVPDWERTEPGATSEKEGATALAVTPEDYLVELRGLEPLTPRLPALCSPN